MENLVNATYEHPWRISSVLAHPYNTEKHPKLL